MGMATRVPAVPGMMGENPAPKPVASRRMRKWKAFLLCPMRYALREFFIRV